MYSALSAQNRQILCEKKDRFLVFELTVAIIIHSIENFIKLNKRPRVNKRGSDLWSLKRDIIPTA